MKRLLGMLAAAIAYLCVGTMLSQCLMLGYAFSKGYLDKDKLAKIVAVAQGLDVAPAVGVEAADKSADTAEQPSVEDLDKRRAVKARHLELREQAIETGLQRIRFEQRKLAEEKGSYDRLKTSFEIHLAELHSGALATGRENIRLIWENIRPKQAKEQILQMIEAREKEDVVAILSAMPIAKRAKIVGEFKTEEEAKKLDDILRLIRRGMPESQAIDQAEGQLKEFTRATAPGLAAGAGQPTAVDRQP